ncbi:hypothetical protein KAR91_69970 [Candidatus Pacearchaeota archaeon]|nr:hypothetical protein [Candidatus Pacearchaeota archaeon]
MADGDTLVLDPNAGTGEGGDAGQVNVEQDPGWMSAVKKEIIEAHGEDMRQHGNINPILEDYYSVKAKVGEAIFKPGSEATEEEVAQYNKLMDIPAAAEGYEFDALPEGVEADEDFDGWFRDIALKGQYSATQAKSFRTEWYNLQAEAKTAQKAEIAETERVLKTELGSGYDAAMANAVRIVELGGEGMKAWLDETGAGNDPRFTRVFAKLGAMISEDSLATTHETGGSSEKTLAERMYPTQGK